jgi:hypothetical protein
MTSVAILISISRSLLVAGSRRRFDSNDFLICPFELLLPENEVLATLS